jgi:tetratricopeptide (TPR) repeat protein
MSVGNLLMDEEKFEEALKFYFAAKNFEPELEFIDLFIGVACFYLGEIRRGKKHITAAIEKEGNDARKLFLEICPEFEMYL